MNYLWLLDQIAILTNQRNYDVIPQEYSSKEKFLWDCLCILYDEQLSDIEKERILQSEYYPTLLKLFPFITIKSGLFSFYLTRLHTHTRLKKIKYWHCKSNKTCSCSIEI